MKINYELIYCYYYFANFYLDVILYPMMCSFIIYKSLNFFFFIIKNLLFLFYKNKIFLISLLKIYFQIKV